VAIYRLSLTLVPTVHSVQENGMCLGVCDGISQVSGLLD
jgi:hypothetical protein